MGSEGGVATRRADWKSPGFLVSAGAHAALLVAMLVHFSHPPEQQDQPETVQVDLVDDPSNQISLGEKIAKLAPVPTRRADKVAEAEEHHPLPPTQMATKDTASLDAPDKANDDPGRGEKPVASAPPPIPTPPPPVPMPPEKPVETAVAPTPPARPVEIAKAEPEKVEPVKVVPEPPRPEPRPEAAKAAPAKPEPAKQEAKEEPDAEAMAPKPPPRPRMPPKEEPKEAAKEAAKEPAREAPKPPHRPVKVAKVMPPRKPELQPEPKPEAAAVPPPRPEPKPEKPSLFDQVASLLKKEPPAPKPRSGNETKDAPRHDDFNPDKIAALFSHEDAQRRASTGRLVTKASLGLPTGHAEKLSPSMAAQIDNWLIDHYRGCWSYFGLGGTQDYVPLVHITMTQDGALIGQPTLLNPPKDPNLRSLAESAIRAVNRCNPMEIPPRFRPYYDKGYKDREVRFDPKEMS